MKLRSKIISGFIIINLMLIIAGAWSIYELNLMGNKVGTLLEHNYEKLNASKAMKEALEREDSALLLLLMDNKSEGKAILTKGDSLFSAKISQIADESNDQEVKIKKNIEMEYLKFKETWGNVDKISQRENKLDLYFEQIYSSFLETSLAVDKSIKYQETKIYNSSKEMEQRSRRAIMPGIVAIISAVIFTILFNFFVNQYIVTPVIEITRRIKKFLRDHIPFDYHISTKDEIANLIDEINILCSHVDSER